LSIAALARVQKETDRLARAIGEGMRLQVLAYGPFLLLAAFFGPVLFPVLQKTRTGVPDEIDSPIHVMGINSMPYVDGSYVDELFIIAVVVGPGKELQEPYTLGAENVFFSGFVGEELRRPFGSHDPEIERAHDLSGMLFHEGPQLGKTPLIIRREPVILLDLLE
jgi:hypothetical protein